MMKLFHEILYGLGDADGIEPDGPGADISDVYAYGGSKLPAKIVFSLEVVTPAGVYTGTYQSHNSMMLQVGNLDLISWNGPSSIPAPTVYLDHSDGLPMSSCPGLSSVPATDNGWDCYSADLKVTVTGDVQGCPWLVSSQITTTDKGNVGATYVGPKVHNSVCPSIPLTTYDVSGMRIR